MAGLSTICACGKEYWTKTAADHGLCPDCQRIEHEQYTNDPAPYVETDSWRWSRSAMRERLDVTGDVDE